MDDPESIEELKRRLAEAEAALRDQGQAATHRQAEAARQDSEERFRVLADSIEDVFYVTDLERGTLEYLSPSYERVWGRPATELLADLSGFIDTIHPEDRPRLAGEKARQARGEPTTNEYRIVRPDGAVRWIFDRSFPVPGKEGRRSAGIASDITDRKQAAEALGASEERQAFLLKLSDALRPLAGTGEIADTACRLLVAQLGGSQAQYAELTGGPGKEMGEVRGEHVGPGGPFPRRFPLAPFGETILAVLRSGESLVLCDAEADPRLDEAQRSAFSAVKAPAVISVPLVKEGRWIAALTVHDVAPRGWSESDRRLAEQVAERTWAAIERARAEAALHESDAKFRTLFESIDEGFCIIDRLPVEPIDFRYVAANPAFQRQSGLEDPVGRTLRELVPEIEDDTLARYARAAEGQGAEVFTARGLDKEFQVEALATGHPGQVAVLFRDVTAARRAEAALRESEERQTFLLRLSDDLRPLSDPVDIQNGAMRVLGQRLGALRVQYYEAEPDDEHVRPGGGYAQRREEMVTTDRIRMDDFGSFVKANFRRGLTVIVSDTATDPRVTEGDARSYSSLRDGRLRRRAARQGWPVHRLCRRPQREPAGLDEVGGQPHRGGGRADLGSSRARTRRGGAPRERGASPGGARRRAPGGVEVGPRRASGLGRRAVHGALRPAADG